MALIKCPECGKEISDKSNICIHCGFPLETIPSIDEELYDIIVTKISPRCVTSSVASTISKMLNMNENELFQKLQCPPTNTVQGVYKNVANYISKELSKRCCDVVIEKSNSPINNDVNAIVNQTLKLKSAPVVCPRCGSDQITTGQRGFSLITGFIGSNKTVNRCAKCGYNWQPR